MNLESLESKVAAAAATAVVFVPTTKWLLGLADIQIDDTAALGLVVVFVLLGGVLWPSRTSVVSSGFSPRAIPHDPVLRQRIKSEVDTRPEGPTPPRDKSNEVGYGMIELVIGVLAIIILVVVLLRVL